MRPVASSNEGMRKGGGKRMRVQMQMQREGLCGKRNKRERERERRGGISTPIPENQSSGVGPSRFGKEFYFSATVNGVYLSTIF